MNRRILLGLALLLLSISPALANHNLYDPFVDLNQIDWFDRELYFAGFDSRPCVDLTEFYAYADSDPYDGHDREDILRYKDRLSASDYQRLADENRYDNIDIGDLDNSHDFACSTRSEFNQFADSNRYDSVDRDDFFQRYGYDGEDEYNRINRHRPYELRNVQVNYYGRADGYGGYASIYRFAPTSYQSYVPYSSYDSSRIRDYRAVRYY